MTSQMNFLTSTGGTQKNHEHGNSIEESHPSDKVPVIAHLVLCNNLLSTSLDNTYFILFSTLTLSRKRRPLNKFVCYLFQGISKSFKVGENIFRVSNGLDLCETPTYSASHTHPSWLHMGLWLRSVG